MNDITQRVANLPPEKRKLLLERLQKKGGLPPQIQIKHRERKSNTFPLSFTQERLWFLEQLDPGNSAYNFVFGERLEGSLNIAALEQALNEIIRRHEILRTAFRMVEGEPRQVIEDEISLKLPLYDLTELSEDKKDAEVLRHSNEVGQISFDLSQAPLVHARLLRREENIHAFLVCIHHIVTDGWSLGVFTRELMTLYESICTGQPHELPELPVQYADFTVWQREWLQGEVLENLLAYWKSQLGGIQTNLELPTDHPRPAMQTFPGDLHTVKLPEHIYNSIMELSRGEGVTLFMTLLAVYNTLLFRYTEQKDIVVGSPIANRDRTEIENLIGFFVSTLVLRTDCSGNPTFRELLSRVREVALGAFSHQDLPFERLVEEIQPERDLSISPLFQVMFILHNPKVRASKPTELQFGTPLPMGNKTAKYDLTLYVEETEGHWYATFEYNTDLFEAATIERMAGHLLCLLEGIVENPDQRLSELPMLTDGERQQLLIQWNATQTDYPRERNFHELFEMQAGQASDAVALVFEKQQLTYGELNARANQLAHYLKKLGVGPDILVGLCIERSFEMVIALLGVLKVGGAYVPLDPSYPQERLDYMLSDSGAKVLLTQESLVTDSRFSIPDLRMICLDRDWGEIDKESKSNPERKMSPTNLAYVIYTSGSTGKPKGVAVQQANLVNFLTSMQKEPGISSDDVLVAVTTLSFDISGLELYLPLMVGAKVILTNRDEAGDGRKLAELLAESNATIMQATPASWRMLLDTDWNGRDKLKMLCGGEALPRELASDLLQKGSSLWNMYGPTETTIWSAVQEVEDKDVPVYIGAPIGNTQIYILDSNLQPVPVGVYGELYIGGEGLARGYLNRADLTADKFVPDPFSRNPGARLYRTGDLTRYLPDGKIEFSGRIDHQVKIRGFRIELGEIEATCIEHPAIMEAVVMPREISAGDMRLVAYIKYNSQDEPTVSELRNYMKEKLPDYMIPSLFVTMDVFPLTPNGKVDRKNLPVPAGMRTETGKAQIPPKTEMEKLIAGIWHDVLGMNSFSVNDNFFELGGHSLLSMKVLYHIEKQLGLRINPREIMFKNLGQLAALCDSQLQRTQKSSSKGKFLHRIKEAIRL